MTLATLQQAVGPAGIEPQAALPIIVGVVILLYAAPAY